MDSEFPAGHESAVLRLNMWFENNGLIVMGVGRMLLLKRLGELGSLRKAADDLKISYRAAWGKIKAAEEHIGEPLVHNARGRGRRLELTEFGRELVVKFETLFNDVEKYALERASELMPLSVEPYDKKREDE